MQFREGHPSLTHQCQAENKYQEKRERWIPIALDRPEGVLGDEGQDDGEGDEGVQPGNVCWKDWRRHLEKSALDASLGGQVPRLTRRGT